jgi:hypothetical protein
MVSPWVVVRDPTGVRRSTPPIVERIATSGERAATLG